VESSDELGELAASFNRMTEDLVQQKDRTLQASAWPHGANWRGAWRTN